MNPRRWLPHLLLVVVAAVSGWWLWQLSQRDEPPQLVGPPRSDYSLEDFELVALDSDGVESFSVRGPRLARHPYLGTLDVQSPRFVFPDPDGSPWQARSDRAWVSAEGDEIRLLRDVRVEGRGKKGGRIELTTSELSVFPRERRAETGQSVTVTAPGSILRGLGLRADFDARRIELLSEVRARYDRTLR
ncbi:MAG TPA: LPS export ABC transporter periplasmic protein LptC [Xanthomonadaceae bacterium]|nr:LPS export ABC transporter periplasmic protein LptC [Xanthomonadaceae bacterium]